VPALLYQLWTNLQYPFFFFNFRCCAARAVHELQKSNPFIDSCVKEIVKEMTRRELSLVYMYTEFLTGHN
jgi:hypothetical protein